MKLTFKHPLAALTLFSLLQSPALHAADYRQLDMAKSSVQFNYQQMGVKMDGQFRQFSGQIQFDPAKPAAARVQFEVALASIDAGSSEANEEVAGKPWFNSKQFPSAHFESVSVKPLAGNRAEVTGKLSIKGRTVDVLVPATFVVQGNQAVFEGSFPIRRGDFAIGEGSWAKFDIVANEVLVKFRITALTGK